MKEEVPAASSTPPAPGTGELVGARTRDATEHPPLEGVMMMDSMPTPALRPDLADSKQRARAVDPRFSFHLEAPAGSGKTSLLAARFLRLLGVVDHPRQILALTFTNKAAGEMRERVGRLLARAAAGAEPSGELDAELLDAAAKALRRHDKRRDLLLGGEFLQIQTFHSFCYAITSQAPLEAGIAPGTSLLVEPDQTVLLRETVDQTLLEIGERNPDDPWRAALENRLLHLNNSWPMLARELEEVLQRREVLGELIGSLDPQKAAEAFVEAVRELAEERLALLQEVFGATSLARSWSDFLQDLRTKGGSAAERLPAEIPGRTWEDLPGWLAIADTFLTRKGDLRKKVGPASGFYSGYAKTEWFAALQAMSPAATENLNAARGLPLRESAEPNLEALWDFILLVQAVTEAYEKRCRDKRTIDFPALELAALRLFDNTSPSDLQLLLDEQIRHVLIDEFQDTNHQQWMLLHRLCAGWTPGDGRTVFLVGDPKQSIYGFRKAEVGLFMEARKGLLLDSSHTLPLESLVLTTNFRSEPGLIRWCNDLFGRTVMAGPRPDLDEVSFIPSTPRPRTGDGEDGARPGAREAAEESREESSVPAVRIPEGDSDGDAGPAKRKTGRAARGSPDGTRPASEQAIEEVEGAPDRAPGHETGETPGASGLIPTLALFVHSPDAASARKREADWIAQSVSECLAHGRSDFTIGILLFTRTHLPVYLEALQERRVVAQVTEGLKLAERPEVQYLLQLCRALVFPHDHLAWAAQLRSPWLLLDYEEFYAVSREEPEPWVEKIREYARTNERVNAFWEHLRDARRHLGHDALADVLEAAWLSLGGARITGRKWGIRGLACCRQFFRLLRDAEVHEPVQTMARLEELLDGTFEPVDPDAASSLVSIMTVHRAKGLEFDAVYLPFLDWNPLARERTDRPPYLLERGALAGGRSLLAVRPDRRHGEPDPIYQMLHRLRAGRRWGEAKRLFYVAATRARSRLIMSGLLPVRGKEAAPTFPGDTPLSWIGEHYGLPEALNLRPSSEAGGGLSDETGDSGFDFPSDSYGDSGARGAAELPASVAAAWRKTWRSQGDDFQALAEPPIPAPVELPSETPTYAAPAPASFERERRACRVIAPSSLAEIPEATRIPEAGDAVDAAYASEASDVGDSTNPPGSADSFEAVDVMDGRRISSSSGVVDGAGAAAFPTSVGSESDLSSTRHARISGILIHRLLESYGRCKMLPSPEGVRTLALHEGVQNEGEAESLAEAALSEVNGCLRDPWLAKLYALPSGDLLLEQPVEAVHSSRTIYSGVVDFAAFFDEKWRLVDFKTSRCYREDDAGAFYERELNKYRPQLAAYREMWAKARGVDLEDVETFIYWTALRRAERC